MKKPLIVIGGPTACGKTGFSIQLAKKIGGEIISADSMQVYRYMDIGTAKVTPEEADGVPHYLIDEFDPDEEYNVMIFQQKAKAYMEEIWAKGKVPILVGGTGFYINALLYDNDFTETENDTTYREECYKLAQEQGPEVLFERLKEVDPAYAEIMHANNVKRVTRALEYHYLTGQKFSEHNAEQKEKESPYDAAVIILNMDREKLYERIELRIDLMMDQGLLEEVKGLLEKGYAPDLVSMQGIGYKEFVPYFNGECTLERLYALGLTAGKNFSVQKGFHLDPSHCWLITVGDDVTFGPQVRILAHDASMHRALGYTRIAPVTIGDRVFIGAGSVVLPGVRVGNDSIVGAGSVVTKSIPAGEVWAGNPARRLGTTEDFLNKHRKAMEYSVCYDESYTVRAGISDAKKQEQKAALANDVGYVV